MATERMRRRLEALLDEADAAVTLGNWQSVAEKARAALAIEADNGDALTFLKMAEANFGGTAAAVSAPTALPLAPVIEATHLFCQRPLRSEALPWRRRQEEGLPRP